VLNGTLISGQNAFYQKGENTRDFSRGMNRPYIFDVCKLKYCENHLLVECTPQRDIHDILKTPEKDQKQVEQYAIKCYTIFIRKRG